MKSLLTLAAIFLYFSPALAAPQSPEDEALKMSEAALGRVIPNLSFTDTEGKKLSLNQLKGKPFLISLVYTGCADVCPTILQSMIPAIENAQETLGVDSFTTLTIGFDTRKDTPDRMRSFARTQGANLPNWKFLSGNSAAIEKLVDATGFKIIPSAGGFDHMAQVSVVDSEGKIYHQILGSSFTPPALIEPIKDVLFGSRNALLSFSGIAERVKLFCTIYNPNTGRYYFNYSLFIGIIIGLACLMITLCWLVREYKLSGQIGDESRHI